MNYEKQFNGSINYSTTSEIVVIDSTKIEYETIDNLNFRDKNFEYRLKDIK